VLLQQVVKQPIVTLLEKFVEGRKIWVTHDSSHSVCCCGGTRQRDVGQTLWWTRSMLYRRTAALRRRLTRTRCGGRHRSGRTGGAHARRTKTERSLTSAMWSYVILLCIAFIINELKIGFIAVLSRICIRSQCTRDNNTRSQAVAMIADRTASQQTI